MSHTKFTGFAAISQQELEAAADPEHYTRFKLEVRARDLGILILKEKGWNGPVDNSFDAGISYQVDLRIFTPEELRKQNQEIERAYGGCRSCYGKGYATYINGTTAYADFGDELGGAYSEHRDSLEMKFCNCDRGKALKNLLEVL